MTHGFLAQLEWRNATKAFDPTRRVSPESLEKVLASIQLAPTSFGLQPFRVHVVEDAGTQQRIFEIGWKQKQYVTASHVLVFSVLTDLKPRIDDFFALMSQGDPVKREGLKMYEGMMRQALEGLPQADAKAWAARQAYIALGFAMAACAELEIDSCPMEGFSPAELDKIMGFGPGEFSSVMLCLGYRDPSIGTRPKFRFPKEKLFVRKGH